MNPQPTSRVSRLLQSAVVLARSMAETLTLSQCLRYIELRYGYRYEWHEFHCRPVWLEKAHHASDDTHFDPPIVFDTEENFRKHLPKTWTLCGPFEMKRTEYILGQNTHIPVVIQVGVDNRSDWLVIEKRARSVAAALLFDEMAAFIRSIDFSQPGSGRYVHASMIVLEKLENALAMEQAVWSKMHPKCVIRGAFPKRLDFDYEAGPETIIKLEKPRVRLSTQRLQGTTSCCNHCGQELGSPHCAENIRTWAKKLAERLRGHAMGETHIADYLGVIEAYCARNDHGH